MIELLAEVAAICFRFLRTELPNCSAVLNDIRSGVRMVTSTSSAYVWLCRLTACAILLQGLAVTLFLVVVGDVVKHFDLAVPPWKFDGDSHYLSWGFSFSTAASNATLHYCDYLAIVTMALFIAVTLGYGTLAWLSKVLVRECCPLKAETSTGVAA